MAFGEGTSAPSDLNGPTSPADFFDHLLSVIRVSSAAELKARIELYLKEVNETPVFFRGKYKLETSFSIGILIRNHNTSA